MNQPTREEALAHFGVKGMKWGVRNEPGAGVRSSKSAKKESIFSEGRGEAALTTSIKALSLVPVNLPTAVVLQSAYQAYKTVDSGAARVAVNRGKRFLSREKLSYKKDPSLASKNMSEKDIMNKVVAGVNPDYPKFGTNTNCRRCTMAYEMRRRGYDVRATKTVAATGQGGRSLKKSVGVKAKERTLGETDVLKSAHPIKDLIIKDKNLTTKAAPDAIFKALQGQPNRSRGEVGLMWQMGGGHSIAYEIIGNKPVLFDTQSGKSFKNTAEFVKHYKVKANKASFTRFDNKKINEAWVERWLKDRD